jgi:transketolase
LKEAKASKEKPTLIIGKTIMGKGARKADGSSFENQCATHGMPLSEAGASFEKSIKNLGGDPADPFVIFDETKAIYACPQSRTRKNCSRKKAAKASMGKSKS